MLGSCSKPDINDMGLTETNLQSDFTVTPVNGSANRFAVAALDSSYILSKWDIGDGAGATIGKHSQTLFFPDAGTYEVTHYAVGRGGTEFATTKTITVATSDPVAGNLVLGGKFESADDESKWTRHVISEPAVVWTRAEGKFTATGGGWGHSAIYQTIQVEANKDYRFGALVSGSGATETWYEVYFGSEAPTPNTDYSSGGARIALNTWAGCATSAFSGNISVIGCAGDLVGQNGVIRFTEGGTKYLFIKTGGANLGSTGISVDNIELRGI